MEAAALARRARAVEELRRLTAVAESDDTPAERLSTVAESDGTPAGQECDHFSLSYLFSSSTMPVPYYDTLLNVHGCTFGLI